ncbi:HD-GYP domain-containing protein [Actinotalea fermentans]|uniref:Uncharacterized protein n=1 Tax=Actinotalea fermentans TaxID=43671 RepID=A0A511Z0M2_9CELL|nr:HD domain-containing phosphohydrolase [Actinotalea fermentans]GEN81004.1 hypothetical protein AFE02nite_27380 [Actinotalea fermentans]
MASGPTQNYDDPTLVSWRPRPALARALRATLAVLPVGVAAAAGLLAVRFLPPERVGLDPWLWLALEVSVCSALLYAVGRLSRRLLPLATLLRLTLVLPDRVPSRAAAVRRSSSVEGLHARLLLASDDPEPDAALLLELVSALARHDHATFRHSERVQSYAALIGRELGLPAPDVARLGWAALLHDVGKLSVPVGVLNKPARPDADEWAALAGHAAAGGELVAPLARWLGPWAAAIDEHHERWDGAGYPRGLAGEQISLAARIVAVADAYDVITSTRAYKSALPADAARAELARCAGAQFEPAIVRAFLAVGLGELRRVAGPLALVGTLPVVPSLLRTPARALGRATEASSTVAVAAPGVAAAMAMGVGLAVATPALTLPPAADAESVVTEVGAGDGRTGPRAEPGEGALAGEAVEIGEAADAADPAEGADSAEGAEPGDGTEPGDGEAADGTGGSGGDAAGPGAADGDTGAATAADAGSADSATPTPRTAPSLPPTASDQANESATTTGSQPSDAGATSDPTKDRPSAE